MGMNAPANGGCYFAVDVPPLTEWASNALTISSTPGQSLSLLYSTLGLPTGALPPEVVLGALGRHLTCRPSGNWSMDRLETALEKSEQALGLDPGSQEVAQFGRDVRRQARFRVFELQMERRKLDLLLRARAADAGRGKQPPAGHLP